MSDVSIRTMIMCVKRLRFSFAPNWDTWYWFDHKVDTVVPWWLRIGPFHFWIDRPRIVSPEEVAARTGIDVELLKRVHAGINAMLNDKELKAKVDAQYYRGNIADVDGLEWYTDAETPLPAGSPLTVGVQQTGRTISTDGWSVPKDDDE